jgi:hypothetical protein
VGVTTGSAVVTRLIGYVASGDHLVVRDLVDHVVLRHVRLTSPTTTYISTKGRSGDQRVRPLERRDRGSIRRSREAAMADARAPVMFALGQKTP